MEKDYTAWLQDIRSIAWEAGDKIMEVYISLKDDDIETKSDQSPLTTADIASHKHIVNRLKKLTPDVPIISEEQRNADYKTRADYTYCWMIDPLDGTKEFIKQNGEFTVNIALLKNGAPIMGVVIAPALQMEYFATLNKGAFSCLKGEKPAQMSINPFRMDDKGIRVVCSRSHMNAETSKFLDELKKPRPIYKGSSLKFMAVAAGDADVYPRIAPTMEWDTAAAQIILEEAGGVVEAYASKMPLTYNKENLLNPYFIARAAYANTE